MECENYRHAISARLDGENASMPASMLEAHLATCTACRNWEHDAVTLARAVRVHSADAIPDLTPAIMAAISHERAPVGRVDLIARWALGIVAVLKLFLDGHQLLTGQVIFHAPRELMSFDIALAVGFLSAAWRPVRAYAMLPLVGALVFLLVTTPGIHPPVADGGYSGLFGETTHILQLAGFGFTWVLSRATPRPVASALLPRRRVMRGAH